MALEEGRGHLRASHADREQAIEALKAAFARERLAKAEFEIRVGQALASRTYAELAAVTADITARPMTGQPPRTPARVREQRIQRQMSQPELAEALGLSRQTLTLIESGRYLPSLPLAFTIARFFDLTVDKMFGPAEEQGGAPPAGKQAGRRLQRLLCHAQPTARRRTAQADVVRCLPECPVPMSSAHLVERY